ncbi:hypothetical protein LEP48_16620 [Isoptericola sp. NEAU-Y5]|uniref:Adenylate cyclase n=1 Tax=Isoptericola luteus TaxID=2879484 RepID=A0ABS7ZIV3_9MICO|nr:hypothetical protein [Isoptericola sp. NEAU-Y5]MCA5894956.1 hypothetical protein [Isoptericola sp. NEAU-Y5]
MTAVPTYDVEQLAGLLAILPDVDSVELKLTVPDDRLRSVVQTLGIDPLDAVVRQISFIDTPDLRLSTAGVVVRARRTQRQPGDLTVKLRPMLPADVPRKLRERDGFKVEVDASPAGFTCSCSLTAAVPDEHVKRLLADELSVADTLDGPQRAMVAERMPQGVVLADLTGLGSITLLKCKFLPAGGRRRMVAELWVLPDGSRILELSMKSAPDAAFQAAAELKVLLAGHGIDLGAPQETKTRAALAALVTERSGRHARPKD